jgi:membrane protease YdiL (CAAX protease family)
MGTLIPLGFSFISRTHLALGTVIDNPIEFIVKFIVPCMVLTALIPFAVKANRQFDLPGGPLITANLNGEAQPYGWGEVLIAGVLWPIFALVVIVIAMIALFVGIGLLAYFFPSLARPRARTHLPPRQIQPGLVVRPSGIWIVCSVVIFAFSAGVQEEILFRFVLVGVFSRALMTISANAEQPSRRQFWLANIMQAYCFGLAHLLPDFHLTSGIVGLGELTIRPFVQPQTFSGLFLGWLYLRHGLETSMVSHIFFDLLVLGAISAIR